MTTQRESPDELPYRAAGEVMQDKYLDAVVVGRRQLTERISEFLVGTSDGRVLPSAEAGGHIELRFGGASGHFLRHYSVVGALAVDSEAEPFWRIAVQRENRSRGSAFIHDNFVVGTRLRASRPLNAFRLIRNQPHHLLIAGGIGITPIFAMARSLVTRHETFSAVYVGHESGSMAYVDELKALCGARLEVVETDKTGLPDLKVLLAGQPENTQVYVCGPSALIDGLVNTAAGLGWAPARIRFEAFNAAHKPDDEGFEVRTRGGSTIQVGAGVTILDALEAAGVETYSDCRRGECGLCLTEIVGCDGVVDHRDHFFSDNEKAEGRRMTICCSRITGKILELNI
jgi:ferredoxin-NADP reductase